jgi:hypothetical protein
MTDIRQKGRPMETTTAATATPEGFSDAEWGKFERFQAAKEARRIAAEREKAHLTTRAILRRNESGAPFPFTSGCTAGDELLPKEICCDGTGAGCRQRRNKPLTAPGETFRVPAGHRRIANPALPEVDPASVGEEPTTQDRLVLGELRSVKQGAEGPATQADRTLTDLKAQRQILNDRILQQQAELDRRRSHVEAAAAKVEEFLSSRSAVWREALLSGAPEASLESIRQAADANKGFVGTMDQLLRRSREGDAAGPAAFVMGAGGQPVKLRTDRSS